MDRGSFLAIVIGSMVALLLTIVATTVMMWPYATAHATTVRCVEDAPCWNWTTKGNHKRGVVLNSIDHKRVVVNHDGFTFLRSMGSIDWKRTPHLKGD